MMRPFRFSDGKSDLSTLGGDIKRLERLVGAENIESIFLVGGAARFLRGSEWPRAEYGDIDLIVVAKKTNPWMVEGMKKFMKDTNYRYDRKPLGLNLMKKSDILKVSPKIQDMHDLTLLEGFPVYNAERGHELQEKLASKLVKKFGERGFENAAQKWMRGLWGRQGKLGIKSSPTSASFLSHYTKGRSRR